MVMAIRQPIVSVLGHVDHGKTSLLDKIRGTTITSKEAGAITQHIGATEVPLETILEICSKLTDGMSLKIPGLLFIDTPGHHSFTTLRARGGALADLAILIVDVREGFMPQTVESLKILKRFKTPFVVAANKVDLLSGWRKQSYISFLESLEAQAESVRDLLMDRIYGMSAELYKQGFSGERYDKVEDFTKNVAIVPVSARTGEGIPDLLLMLIGLAQRFLEKQLVAEDDMPGEATVLEVKDVKGLGLTMDAILYRGRLSKGESVVIGTVSEPVETRIRALLKPRPLEEIRDTGEEFTSCEAVTAAAGIKISASDLEGIVSGAPLRAVNGNVETIKEEIRSEMALDLETEDEGLTIKADAIGSLEALAFELKNSSIPIRKFEIGNVTKKDVTEVTTIKDPLKKAILAFNVTTLPDTKEELESWKDDVQIFSNNVIYKLIDDYKKWSEEKRIELDKSSRREIAYPAKLLFLENCSFRVSKPAIFGVRVLAGRISVGKGLLKEDGRSIGKIKSIQMKNESIKEAVTGDEVALAVSGITIGRQIKEGDVLYSDIPEVHIKLLKKVELNVDEDEALQKILEIKRREDAFWGM
jgi:translation initiation factor 5B